MPMLSQKFYQQCDSLLGVDPARFVSMLCVSAEGCSEQDGRAIGQDAKPSAPQMGPATW